ncbi:MAG: hypothetical protein OXB88_09040 [Bacteriovoracales bacterium]|nr:hypothetical protein [Bacteriovoracales bacterium]
MKMMALMGIFLMISSCAQKNDPVQTLTKFVNYRFSSGQTKERILEMTSGNFHQSILQMSDDAFESFSQMQVKKKYFKILKAQCTGQKCSISYIIKYDRFNGDEKSFIVETKKMATVENIDGVWKIADITNIKEFHEPTSPIKIQEK